MTRAKIKEMLSLHELYEPNHFGTVGNPIQGDCEICIAIAKHLAIRIEIDNAISKAKDEKGSK